MFRAVGWLNCALPPTADHCPQVLIPRSCPLLGARQHPTPTNATTHRPTPPAPKLAAPELACRMGPTSVKRYSSLRVVGIRMLASAAWQEACRPPSALRAGRRPSTQHIGRQGHPPACRWPGYAAYRRPSLSVCASSLAAANSVGSSLLSAAAPQHRLPLTSAPPLTAAPLPAPRPPACGRSICPLPAPALPPRCRSPSSARPGQQAGTWGAAQRRALHSITDSVLVGQKWRLLRART